MIRVTGSYPSPIAPSSRVHSVNHDFHTFNQAAADTFRALMGDKVESRREFIEKLGVRRLVAAFPRTLLVWDTNVVKISLFTVKLFTLILSTLRTGRGELRGAHIGCLMRKSPYASVTHGAHAVICGV